MPQQSSHYAEIDMVLGKRIADAYESSRHEPQNPQVAESYRHFIWDTIEQFVVAKRYISFEPWTRQGQLYRNSGEMMRDVRRHRHLFIYIGGDLPADHPMAQISNYEANGVLFTYNHLFRAVHDLHGHAKEGFEFGPRGEENAWRAHALMFRAESRPAMTTETRGQNCWTNFGGHLRNANGELRDPGDPEFLHLSQRPYAEQKATLLPSWCW